MVGSPFFLAKENNMKKILKSVCNFVASLFFPNDLKCMFCSRDVPNAEIKPYCDDCEIEQPFNRGKRCKICDVQVEGDGEVCEFCSKFHKHFDKSVSAMRYEGEVRKVVLKLKNNNAKYLAPKMAKLMCDRLCEERLDVDVVIPVPLSKKSLKKRKYNQSELLAKEISLLINKTLDNTSFAKTLETKHQKELTYMDRQKNLHSAFKVLDKKNVFGKNILLVDDVVTTGATANECAKTLKKYCEKVYVVSFARSPYKK